MSLKDCVICPNCCHEFTAIPVAAQEQIFKMDAALRRINEWCCYATEGDVAARLMALQQIGQAAREALA